jgi:hypothetical protein
VVNLNVSESFKNGLQVTVMNTVPTAALRSISTTGLVCLCLLAFTSSASAKMYKWTDAEGNMHYTQKPPPESARESKQMTVRTGSVVKVRQRGKRFYCGDLVLPSVSKRPASAIANLRASLLNWNDNIERINEQREKYIKGNADRATTARFSERMREYDKDVAQRECQIKWGKEKLASLADDKDGIIQHHKKLEALQVQVVDRKKSNCGDDTREGVIVVDKAYRDYLSCAESYERELRKLEKSLRKAKKDADLVTE